MNIDQIQANKPEGATHYFKRLDYVSYWMVDNGIYCWSELFLSWVSRENLKYSRVISIDDLKPL